MNSAKASPANKTGIITPPPAHTATDSAAPGRTSALPALLTVNLLTGSRIILSVGLVLCILSGAPGRALALLAAIYATDIMDGRLARRWRAVTRAGAHFDLAADIWFVVLSCSALVIQGLMPFWFLLAAAFKFAEFAATSYYLSGVGAGRGISQSNRLPEVPRSPVFDSVGRLSGILFMAAPVPAILMNRILPLSLATILFTCLAVCICILSLISSCRRLYLCSPVNIKEELAYSK